MTRRSMRTEENGEDCDGGSRPTRKKTRAVKERIGAQHQVKEKFVEEREARIFTIQPKSENQQKFMDALRTKQLVVGEGRAGVGKSMLSCVHAANQYLKGNCKKIVLLRPYVQVGKTAGLLPGSLKEKLTPLLLPMLDNLSMVFGQEKFKYMLEHDVIAIEAVENVRGRSYRDSVVIVDECQNITPQEVNALVTRLEETSQLILIGDSHQSDLKGVSGISFISDLLRKLKQGVPDYFDENDRKVLFERTGCVTFTDEDIVRSGLCRMMVKVFDRVKE